MDRLPVSRRRFLRHTAALGAVLSLWPAAAIPATAHALVPRRLFFVQPDYGNVRVSPDGSQLAYLAPANGVRNLFVAPVSAPNAGRQVTRATDRDIGGWYQWAHTNRHIVFFRDRDGDENWRASSIDLANGAVTLLTPERGVRAFVQEPIFGISNLLTFMAAIPPYWGPWFSVWKKRLGDPDTETGRALLRSRSPLFHLERATRPILIAQGMQDVRVVAAESEQMVAALKKNGAPVTYVSFPDEGHGFVRPENRLAFYAVVEAFLAKHLGGRYQPIGMDFKGSSLKVETGGELVPGLIS